ncbi:MAG TPA: DUF2202 domain-containing protein [Candidatus Limiplasma sp.]|nr:DUF2202 domain-containing protein [Candidatus Limiplasma sp.]
MKTNKIAAMLLTLTLMVALPMATLAEDAFGSAAVTAGQTYTLEQMLTYAMQDEYMAQAEYGAIQTAYGANAPFANIQKAEDTHVALLQTLFATYNLTAPENTAAAKVTTPATLEDAYAVGVAAETANIAMYQTFLAQTDVPDDVRSAFTVLENASQNHLTAFSRNTGRYGTGMMGNRRDDGTVSSGNGNGNGNRNNDGTLQNGVCSEDCPLYDGSATTCVGCGQQGRMGGGRNRAN